MKISFDKTYLKYSLYIIMTATVLYILYAIISHIGGIFTTIFNILSNISSLLAPFIIAFIIAYLLHPIVNLIEKYIFRNKKLTKFNKNHKLKRTLSVLITYLVVIGLFTLFIYSTYMMIGGQITKNVNVQSMINTIGEYASKYNDIFVQISDQLQKSGLSDDLKVQLQQFVNNSKTYINSAINGTFNFIKNLGSNIFNIFLGLIISFYMLKDIDYFRDLYHNSTGVVLKRRTNAKLSGFFGDVNKVVSSFIRGQLLDGIIVGILSSIGLAIVGIEFPLLIGMTAGIANIIPYFGPIIGSVPAVIVGLLSGNPIKALFAVLVLIAVQQLDGAIIAPKVVGESVGLHPVFVILSIVIGGAYFGLLGMLLAVPTAGIIKLFVLRYMDFRKHNGSTPFE